MTGYQDDDGADVGEALRSAFVDEPPLMLDAGTIAQQGARALRHRRRITIGGAVLAVAVLTAGVAVGVPRLAGSSGTASHSTVQVPGCAAVVSTDDPAVKAWHHRTPTSQARQPSSLETGATPSSSGAATTAGTTGSAAATDSNDVYGQSGLAWLTKEKAARMAAAFAAAMPAGVHLSAPDASTDAGPLPFAAGSGVPGGGVVITAGSTRAYLTIYVVMSSSGVPPCTTQVTHRYTSPDGTITDVFYQPRDGFMGAQSYRPDGTLVGVGFNNSGNIVPSTYTLPLTVQQLAAIAATPALAITAP